MNEVKRFSEEEKKKKKLPELETGFLKKSRWGNDWEKKIRGIEKEMGGNC